MIKKIFLSIIVFGLAFAIPWFAINYVNQTASVFSYNYDQSGNYKPLASAKKIRILIVPGHEPNYGGAEFGVTKERDLTVEIGQDLKNFLEQNSNYQVFITRDTEDWNPIFADYFKKNWNDIIAWEKLSRQEEIAKISSGEEQKPIPTVLHNTVPDDVGTRLYGIIKWADENSIDLMIHIHIDDYAGHSRSTPGKYSGFSIYVPVEQYNNSQASHNVAEEVLSHLTSVQSISNLKAESGGIIDEPRLIAIGAHNTSVVPSMLIEYGYIYENKFTNVLLRPQTLKNMAYQTYLGIQDFFNK